MTGAADKQPRDLDRLTAEIARVPQSHADCMAMAGELSGLLTCLEASLEQVIQASFNAPFKGPDLHTEHRRNHRRGTPAKLDADHELRAFVQARLATLTFEEIALEITRAFPKDRHVSRSSLHRWWTRNRPNKTPLPGEYHR